MISKTFGSGGIRTHAPEETGALNQRLRPLGHATYCTADSSHRIISTSTSKDNTHSFLPSQRQFRNACSIHLSQIPSDAIELSRTKHNKLCTSFNHINRIYPFPEMTSHSEHTICMHIILCCHPTRGDRYKPIALYQKKRSKE